MKTRHTLSTWTRISGLVIVAALATTQLHRATALLVPAPQAPAAAVADAWANVKNSERYSFTANVVMTARPEPTAGNIGRVSKTEHVYLEGTNEVRAKNVELAVWGGALSTLDRSSAYQLRVRDGVAQTRVGDEAWRDGDSSATALAPDGDVLSFLDSARNIQRVAQPGALARDADCAQDCDEVAQYSFEIDARAYAERMTRIAQRELERKGALPPGAAMAAPAHLSGISGEGMLWVDARGLPVRQRVTLNIPAAAGSDNASTAVFDTRFENYVADLPSQTVTPLLQPVARAILRMDVAGAARAIALLAGTMLMAGLLARNGRKAQRLLAPLMVASMTLQPVMTAHAGNVAMDRYQALRAEQQARAAETAEAAAPPAAAPRREPYAPPAEASAALQTARAADTDSDGDTLSDVIEDLIGTDPTDDDSDADGITDELEVAGFDHNGRRWYGNPLLADSNGDGRIDTEEWNVAAPDNDGDGVPDVYDFDDDGDGVPDKQDLSPSVASKNDAGQPVVFGEYNPLALTLGGLEAGRFAHVNVQLRPSNPNQLWWAYNVLNWPRDKQGNMQDWDGMTFYDNCVRTASGSCNLTPDANGDIKLVPMLEVSVPDAVNLPRKPNGEIDTAMLGNYGITAQPSGNGGYLLYAPLNVIEDPETGNKVAFESELLYRASGTWRPQQMRILWLVQVLNESYASPDAGKKATNDGRQFGNNKVGVLHVYYTDFGLTGLNVREDRGTQMAVAFEDPASDPNVDEDEALTMLMNGIDNTFMVNRDCDFVDNDGLCVGDGQRDITISTLKARFDRASNSGITEGQRWGIGQNRLRVQTYDYAQQDEATVAVGRDVVPAILNTYFTSSTANKPALLVVREDRFRSRNIEGRAAASAGLAWTGSGLSVSFAGAEEMITGGYNLAPYRRVTPGNTWTRQTKTEFVNTLEQRYPLTVTAGSQVPTVTLGTQVVIVMAQSGAMEGNHTVLSQKGEQGFSSVLAAGLQLTSPDLTDEELRNLYVQAFAQVGQTVAFIHYDQLDKLGIPQNDANKIFNKVLKHVEIGRTKLQLWITNEVGLGKEIGGQIASVFLKAKPGKDLNLDGGQEFELAMKKVARKQAAAKGRFAINVASLLAMPLGFFLTHVKGAQTVGEIVLASTNAAQASLDAVVSAQKLVGSLKDLKSINVNAFNRITSAHILTHQRWTLSSGFAKAGAVGAGIGLAATWGIFFAAWGKGGLSTDSVEFNTLLAGTLGSTLVVVISFFLSFNPIGAIVLAVVAIFDLITLIICKAGVKAACSLGITEAITKLISDWIYTGGVMIDMNADPALTNIDDANIVLTRPDRGMVVGNGVKFDINLLTVVRHAVPEPGIIYHFDNFFTPEDLRSSTVKYTLESSARKLKVDPNQSEWQQLWSIGDVEAEVPSPVVGWLVPTIQSKSLYQGARFDRLISPVYTFTRASINITYPVWLNTGLALPRYDCWFQVCVHKTARTSVSSNLGKEFVLDVLPATLDDFAVWAELGAQTDRDGDGLPDANRAIDPNPASFDSDADGLPDGVEYKYGVQRGYGFNPAIADGDGDGLTDTAEARNQTDPRAADTDRDGISDLDEINGYTMTLQGRVVWVTSHPLSRDTDVDGMSDGVELRLNRLSSERFPFHPRIVNDPPARIYSDFDDDDGVLAIGDRLVFTTTVFNGTTVPDNLVATGLFSTTLPGELGGASQRKPFTLLAGAENNIVLAGAASAGNRYVSANTGLAADLYPVGSAPSGPLDDILFDSLVPLTIDSDAPDAPTLEAGAFVMPGRSVVIGGTATDPTSYIKRVDVSINNGPMITATGTALWAYAFDTPNVHSGVIPLRVRATDAGRNTRETAFNMTIDGISPTLSVDLAPGATRQVRRNAAGNWTLALGGIANDNAAGIGTIDVQIGNNSSRVITGGQLGIGGAWAMTYEFDDNAFNADPRPTGPLTLTVVVRDNAIPDGNPRVLEVPFVVDMTAPTVTLQSHRKNEERLVDGAVLSGTIADDYSGVGGLEIAFVAAATALGTEQPLLRLPLNDLPQTVLFANKAEDPARVYCLDNTCPASGIAGADETAASFDGNDLLRMFDPLDLPESGVSTVLWFNTSCPNCGLMSVVQGAYPDIVEHDRDLFLAAGKVCVSVKTGAVRDVRCSEAGTYADGQWHQAVHVLGAGGNMLFVDGELAVSSPTTASTFSAQDGVLIGHAAAAGTPLLTGKLDDITIYSGAVSIDTARALYRQWRPVTVTNGSWSYPIPAGLEGVHQIDMRGTDGIGNRADDRGTWPKMRAMIDTKFPTFDLNVSYSGSGSAAQTTFSALIKDVNLSTEEYSFACPLTDAQKRYDASPEQRAFTGRGSDQLTGIDAQCTVPGFQNGNIAARACDTPGHCASATPPQTVAYFGASTNRLYPSGSLPNAIERAVLSDPAGRVQLIKRPGAQITDIAIDEPRGKIYWAERSEGNYAQPGRVMRANLDGSGIQQLAALDLVYAPEALQIAVDSVGNRLYWTRGVQLWAANLDGTQPQMLYSVPRGPAAPEIDAVNQIGEIAIDRAGGKLYLSERRQRGDQATYLTGVRNFGQIFKHTLIVQTDLNGQNPGFVAGAGAGCTYANFYDNLGYGVGAGEDPILCLTGASEGFDVESMTVSDGVLYWSQVDATGNTGSVMALPVTGTLQRGDAVAQRIGELAVFGNSRGLQLEPLPQLYVAPGSQAVFATQQGRVLRGEPGGSFTLFADYGAAEPTVLGRSSRAGSALTAMAVTRQPGGLQTAPNVFARLTSPDLVVLDGATGRYDLVFGNDSAVPAGNATLTLTLPAGATFASASQACSANGAAVVCALGTLPANTQAGLTISYTLATSTVRVLTATASIGIPLSETTLADNSETHSAVRGAPSLSALPGTPYIYGSIWDRMIRVPLLASNPVPEPVYIESSVPVTGFQTGASISYDEINDRLFVVNELGYIATVRPDGTDYRPFASASGPAYASGQLPAQEQQIVVVADPISQRVYWTQRDTNYLSTIKSARLDGSDVRTIITQTYNQRGLAVDGVRGRVLWTGTDRNERLTVFAVNADGSGLEAVFVPEAGRQMKYLSIDPYAQKLYWLDPGFEDGTIFRADSDGQNVQFLRNDVGGNSRGIVVRPAENALYFLAGAELVRTQLDGSAETSIAIFSGAQYTGVSNLDGESIPWTFLVPPNTNLVMAIASPFAPPKCTLLDGNEPNDSAAQATAIGAGTYTAALCRSSYMPALGQDRDYYSVSVPSGQIVTMTLTSPPGADFNLHAQREDEVVAVSSLTTSTIESVGVANYETGTRDVLFGVSAFSGAGPARPYTIAVTLAAAPPQTSFSNAQCAAVDPYDAPLAAGNGNQGNATPLTVSVPITGALCYNFDSDFYKFDGVAGQTLAISLPVQPGNYGVHVYRPDGSFLNAFNAGGTWRFDTLFQLDATGTWAVAVIDPDYKSTLSQYQLIVRDLSCSLNDANEPNNTPSQATMIGSQARVRATLCSEGDVDFYQLNATAGQQMTISNPLEGVGVVLTLLGPNNEELRQILPGTQQQIVLGAGGVHRIMAQKAGPISAEQAYVFRLQTGAATGPVTTTPYIYYSTGGTQLMRVSLGDEHRIEPMFLQTGTASSRLAQANGRLFVSSGDLSSVDPSGFDRVQVIGNVNPDGVGTLNISLAVDEESGRVFWLQPVGALASTGFKVMRADANGGNVTELAAGYTEQGALLIDPIKALLYWVASDDIYRSNLDGTNVQLLRSGALGEQVRDLALDPLAQRLYWLDTAQGRLMRAKADGSGATALLDGLGASLHGIAIRPQENELYFSAGSSLMRASLNGVPTATIATLSGTYNGPFNLNPNSFTSLPIAPPDSNLVLAQAQPLQDVCAAADALEPNNSSSTARAVALITSTVLNGALCNSTPGQPTDMDYFTVTVPVSKVLSAVLDDLPADYRLIILHPNGYAAAFSDQPGLAVESGVITNTGASAVYTVLVMSGWPVQNPAPYRLSLSLNDLPPPPNPDDAICSTVDPLDAPGTGNGTLASASAGTFGMPHAGALCYAGDVDMVWFNGRAGQSIGIDLPTRPADYALTVYAPGGAVLTTLGPSGALAYGAAITLNSSGRFTVGVSMPALVPTAQQYQLLVSDRNCSASDANEPNNDGARVTVLTDGSRVRASLCDNTDVDVYHVNAGAGQRLTINYPVNAGGAAVQVSGPAGVLGSVISGTQGVYTLTTAGIYTLSVANPSFAGSDAPYWLQVFVGAPPAPVTGTPYIYYSRVSDWIRADTQGGTIEPVLTSPGGHGGDVIASDPGRGRLFVLTYNNQVARFNLDGTGGTVVIANTNPNGVLRPTRSLAVDESSGRIYWTESMFGVVTRIMSANGDGSDVREVQPQLAGDQGIAIDSVAGQIYWVQHSLTDGEVVDNIRRSSLTGGTGEIVHVAPAGREIRELAIDPFARALLWRDPTRNKLLRMAIDGGSVETLADVSGDARGFVLRPLDNELYYASNTSLIRSTLSGANPQEIARLSGSYNGVSNLDNNVFYPTTLTPPGSNLALGYGVPFASPCGSVDAFEPNDTPETAAAITPGTLGAAMCTRTLLELDMSDYYSTVVPAGKQISVALTQLPQNYYLILMQNGSFVANDPSVGTMDKRAAHVNSSGNPATYTIWIARFADTVSSRLQYSLTVEIGDAPPPPPPPPPPPDLCAPVDAYDAPGYAGNWSINTATPISFNQPVMAALCYPADKDWYSFNGQIGQNVQISLSTRPADYYVYVYNPSGAYVNGIFPGSWLNYGDKLTLNASGEWKVLVWQPGVAPTTTQYVLELGVNTACSGLDPYEPNDDQFNGSPITTRTLTLRATLCETDDFDYYTLPVTVGDRISITPRLLSPGTELVFQGNNGGWGDGREPLDFLIINPAMTQYSFGLRSQELIENLAYEVDINVIPAPTPTPQPNNWTCAIYPSASVPRHIDDLVTIASTVTVPANGVVTHVGLRNIHIQHGWPMDTEFGLRAPDGTTARIANNYEWGQEYYTCGGSTGCYWAFDDAAIEGLIPPSFFPAGNTYRPNVGSFAPFNGRASAGEWTLTVSDAQLSFDDGEAFRNSTGDLLSWSLEVCIDNGNPPTPPPTATPSATAQPTPGNGTPLPPTATSTPTPVTTVAAPVCVLTPDDYEPDNSPAAPSAFNLAARNSGQRGFSANTDLDWMSFDATAGLVYTFSANALAQNTSVGLAIFSSGGITNYGTGAGQIVFSPAQSGAYLLRAASALGALAPCGSAYNIALQIGNPAAGGIISPTDGVLPPGHDAPLLSAAVLTPGNGSAYTQVQPISISIGLNAQYTIAAASLRVNDEPVDAFIPPAPQRNAIWATTWTPPGAGAYTLTAIITDGTSAAATSPAHVLFVDLSAPTISIISEPITTAKLITGGVYPLRGTVIDDSRPQVVEVSLNGGAWQAAVISGSAWTLAMSPQALANPDGGTLTVTARAIDKGGRVATSTASLLVDVVPPAPFRSTTERLTPLARADASTLITPGVVITDMNVRVSWPAITGAMAVYAGWSASPTPTLAELSPFGPEAGASSVTATQGTRMWAVVIALDVSLNRTTAASGPFLFDAPETPDLIGDLAQADWTNSGGKQVGQMRTSDRGTQQLFAGWDASQLRLRWAGANVGTGNDLYLYLGTGVTGTAALFNPAGPNQPGVLPFNATHMVRLAAGFTPTVYAVSSGAWVPQGPVSVTLTGDSADVLLSFASLGIANPAAASLALLGVASDAGTLAPWATAPDQNIGRAWTQFVFFPSLGAGVVPQSGRWDDAELGVDVTSIPSNEKWIGPGQPVTINVALQNIGTATLPTVTVTAAGTAGVAMSGARNAANLVVSGTASLEFTGIANADGSVALTVTDSYHRPYLLQTLSYRVDVTAPVAAGLPISYVKPGRNVIVVGATDESGVAQVQLEVNGVLNACTFTLRGYRCVFTLSGVADGDPVTLRVRGTDIHGNSGFGPGTTVRVDNKTPRVQLTPPSTGALADGRISNNERTLFGVLLDTPAGGSVQLCQVTPKGVCASSPVNTDGTWALQIPGLGDGIAAVFTLVGYGPAGNASLPITISTIVDTIEPVLGNTRVTSPTAALARTARTPVGTLSGTVTDEGGVAGVKLHVVKPDGSSASVPATLNGNAWSAQFAFEAQGTYHVSVVATDLAGNQSTQVLDDIVVDLPPLLIYYLPIVSR